MMIFLFLKVWNIVPILFDIILSWKKVIFLNWILTPIKSAVNRSAHLSGYALNRMVTLFKHPLYVHLWYLPSMFLPLSCIHASFGWTETTFSFSFLHSAKLSFVFPLYFLNWCHSMALLQTYIFSINLIFLVNPKIKWETRSLMSTSTHLKVHIGMWPQGWHLVGMENPIF